MINRAPDGPKKPSKEDEHKMSDHFIKHCVSCNAVTSQCRCASNDKLVIK
jgi:hypothetical protein